MNLEDIPQYNVVSIERNTLAFKERNYSIQAATKIKDEAMNYIKAHIGE